MLSYRWFIFSSLKIYNCRIYTWFQTYKKHSINWTPYPPDLGPHERDSQRDVLFDKSSFFQDKTSRRVTDQEEASGSTLATIPMFRDISCNIYHSIFKNISHTNHHSQCLGTSIAMTIIPKGFRNTMTKLTLPSCSYMPWRSIREPDWSTFQILAVLSKLKMKARLLMGSWSELTKDI